MAFPYWRLTILALSTCVLLSGCFRSAAPDAGVRALRTQTEKQALRQAKLAFLQADYETAVLRLNRFLLVHPQSPRSWEARWWLARAYRRTGNLSAAREQFRLLATTWNVYQDEARLRMQQLEERSGAMVDGSVRGTLVSLASLQTPGDVEAVISANRALEGSMILLDVPCDGNEHLPEPFSLETMRSAVQRLHVQGARIYLGVTLRCVGNFSRTRQQELANWQDWNYDPQSGSLQRSSYYALNFWGYQAFLANWIVKLRDLPLTGLVFRNEVPVGPQEGFNPLAIRLFAREFDVDFDPARLFNDYRVVTGIDSGDQLPSVFWKWAGWKARERLRILLNLIQTVRVHLPRFEFGITLQASSVTDPLRGLVHFAEDWVDVTRGPFDLFLIRTEDPDVSQGLPVAEERDKGDPVTEVVQRLGTPEKVWTILPRHAVPVRAQASVLPQGIGRLYDHRVVP